MTGVEILATKEVILDCAHCDNDGFCRVYSDCSVVWKCPGDADCEKYVEGENGR